MRISDWSSDVCSSDLIVGDTTFRITIPSSLDPTVANWKALQATPKADKPLPVVKSTKLERAKEDAKKKAQAKAQSETARTAPVQTSEPTAKVERSEEHTSELQSLMRTSYAVSSLKKKIIQ